MVGRVIFMSNGIGHALQYIGRMFTFDETWASVTSTMDWQSLFMAFGLFVFVLVVDIIQECRPKTTIFEKVSRWYLGWRWMLYIGVIFAIILFGWFGEGLPTFQFGYVQY